MPTERVDSRQHLAKLELSSAIPVSREFYTSIPLQPNFDSVLVEEFSDSRTRESSDEVIEVLADYAQRFGAERAIFQWMSGQIDWNWKNA